MLVWQNWNLPPFRAKFDSQPKRLDYFLTQVGNYLERYSALHPDELLCVDTITLNLEEDIVEWLVTLYDK